MKPNSKESITITYEYNVNKGPISITLKWYWVFTQPIVFFRTLHFKIITKRRWKRLMKKQVKKVNEYLNSQLIEQLEKDKDLK